MQEMHPKVEGQNEMELKGQYTRPYISGSRYDPISGFVKNL